MSYFLYDANGYLQDFSTNKGLNTFRNYVEKAKMPYTEGFLNKGATLLTPAFEKELRKALPKNKNVQSVLNGLIEAVKKADILLILSNGID